MTDQRSPEDLEHRLASGLHHADLPGAPASLRDALERIPDAPVGSGRARAAGRGRTGSSAWGLLGLAAVLLLGGALAVGVGGLRPGPSTVPDASPTPVASTQPVTRLTYQAQWTAARPESPDRIRAIETVLRARIAAAGVVGGRVDSLGAGQFRVELPSGPAVESVRGILGVIGNVAFVPLGDQAANAGDRIDIASALFGSEGVAGASIGVDQLGQRVVIIELTPAASATFGTWTAEHIGSYLAIAVDGVVLTAPVIQAEIPGGEVQISQGGDGWKEDEAIRIAAVLSSGPLPVALLEVAVEAAPPSPVATAPVGPSPVASGSPEPDPTVPLVRVRGDLGCDSIMPPYRSWVFHLDPHAAEPVWAIADTGARLRVEWGSDFRGLVGPPPVIVDGEGLVVVREGTAGTMPDAAWPSLGDHFVCPGPETLYVFNEPLGG